MANDNGAIPGESESTDGLIDQYRRYALAIWLYGRPLRLRRVAMLIKYNGSTAVGCRIETLKCSMNVHGHRITARLPLFQRGNEPAFK